MTDGLVKRLRERARIRRKIPSRKSVREGQPDRIADLLEEAAAALSEGRTVEDSAERIFLQRDPRFISEREEARVLDYYMKDDPRAFSGALSPAPVPPDTRATVSALKPREPTTYLESEIHMKPKPSRREVEANREKLRDRVLAEREKGNVVFHALPGQLAVVPLDEFIKQPADGILYDLNRGEEISLTFLNDPKWVNDFAVALVIRKLKAIIEAHELPRKRRGRK